MRVLELTRWRLRGALRSRGLLAPAAALAAVELVILSGGRGPAAAALVTSIAFAVPLLAWAGRQVLDAEPDDQIGLSSLAVGGLRRANTAGLLATCAVTVAGALLCAAASLLYVDENGVALGVLAAGTALAMAAGLVAAAVGSAASRAIVNARGGSVIVLVVAPVVLAVAGLRDSPLIWLLVPRLDEAVRAAYDDRLAQDGLGRRRSRRPVPAPRSRCDCSCGGEGRREAVCVQGARTSGLHRGAAVTAGDAAPAAMTERVPRAGRTGVLREQLGGTLPVYGPDQPAWADPSDQGPRLVGSVAELLRELLHAQVVGVVHPARGRTASAVVETRNCLRSSTSSFQLAAMCRT